MPRIFSILIACLLINSIHAGEPATVKPLKVLLVCGGCCHDYTKQKLILQNGIQERAHAEVTVVHHIPPKGESMTNSKIPLYNDADWAKGYDVVIHDECFADVKDPAFVDGILKPHQAGVPAVNLHCAMHCYRTEGFPKPVTPWFAFTGLATSGHGPQLPIDIAFVDKEHPITKGLSDWTTIKEELYNNLKVYETAHVLARGKQAKEDLVLIWTNDYNKTRVFNTTLGHNNETVADPRYLDLVTRGTLWACDKLNDTYLKPRKTEK